MIHESPLIINGWVNNNFGTIFSVWLPLKAHQKSFKLLYVTATSDNNHWEGRRIMIFTFLEIRNITHYSNTIFNV